LPFFYYATGYFTGYFGASSSFLISSFGGVGFGFSSFLIGAGVGATTGIGVLATALTG